MSSQRGHGHAHADGTIHYDDHSHEPTPPPRSPASAAATAASSQGSGSSVSSASVPPAVQTAPRPVPALTPEQLGPMLLFFASAGDPNELLKKLDEALALGVDVNLTDPFGNTMLHWAASRGADELVKKLLLAGADPQRANMAAAHTPLHWACPEGNLKVVLNLVENGAKMDVVDLVGREPLFYAVANERVPLVHLLLLKDAPQDTRDNGGNSALHWAAKGGNIQILHLLLSAGGFDVNAQNNLGETPLHIAAKEDKLQAFKGLMRFGGANVDIRNTETKTAFEIATGEVKNFLSTEYSRNSTLYGPKPKYNFNKLIKEGAFTYFLYFMAMFLVSQFGLLIGVAAGAAAFYAWRSSKYFVAPDDFSVFWLSLIYGGYFMNLYTWNTSIRPVEMDVRPMENTLFFVGSVTSFLVSQVLIWKFGDPGYISTTPEDDAIGFYEDIRRGVIEFHLCPTCRIRRPLRAKHDGVTDRCIQRFDHFCQFTDQPVGQKNHLMFLLALSFVCIHFNLFAYISFRHLPASVSEVLSREPLIVYHFLQSIAYAAFMNYLLLRQAYNIGTGYTTNEKLGQAAGKYIYLWRDGQPYTPFSRGSFVDNIADFVMRTDRYNTQFYLPGEVPVSAVVVQRQ